MSEIRSKVLPVVQKKTAGLLVTTLFSPVNNEGSF